MMQNRQVDDKKHAVTVRFGKNKTLFILNDDYAQEQRFFDCCYAFM